jgi:hypothetical protein
VKVLAALALAHSGDTARSRTMLDGLRKAEPNNTLLKIYWFRIIEGSLALDEHAPDRAILALEPALLYELGGNIGWSILPTFVERRILRRRTVRRRPRSFRS